MSPRFLSGARGFIDLGGIDPVGLNPNLPQQVEPARRGGSEHEKRRRHQSVIPADATRRSA